MLSSIPYGLQKTERTHLKSGSRQEATDEKPGFFLASGYTHKQRKKEELNRIFLIQGAFKRKHSNTTDNLQ